MSILDSGSSGLIVEIEAQITNGLPAIIIVGSVNNAVNESKERVRSALTNSSLLVPRKRIVINLAPSDLAKKGASLDLAIAVSILVASKQINPLNSKYIFIGELGLDGSVRAVRGVIGKILSIKNLDKFIFVIPGKNLEQAKAIKGIEILPVSDLSQLYAHLNGQNTLETMQTDKIEPIYPVKISQGINISEISGQYKAKRALEIAAAGGHNLLLLGPPGMGKTMLAKALIDLLPVMNDAEVLEVTHLHSLSSNNFDSLEYNRPFRTPHHTATYSSIVGGGQNPKPGEISLSHRGVLFMDEFPEYSTQTINALRQPLEEKTITVSRMKETVTYPADFILLATANPCPCGNFMSKKDCICSPNQINYYQKKLSGPVMDRIDLFCTVEDVDYSKLLDRNQNNEDEAIKLRVINARSKQLSRYSSPGILNSNIANNIVRSKLKLADNLVSFLNSTASKLNLSARSYMKVIKVSRTIADLDNSEDIKEEHLIESLQFRQKNII